MFKKASLKKQQTKVIRVSFSLWINKNKFEKIFNK